MSFFVRGEAREKSQRAFERVDVLAPITFRSLSGGILQPHSHGVVIDIAPDGIFVQTRTPPTADEWVGVDIDLIQLHEHIKAIGKIVRQTKNGFALKFGSRCVRLASVHSL
ncbi:MAG: hypothetical protein C0608_02865 [Deltaproteobacteria bacterium]|nr:MAG: hypothetical protein C0608_02865 [Deltaproteobacteria bacterium]